MTHHVRETGRLVAQLPRHGRGKPGTKLPESDFRQFIDASGLTDRTARNWQSIAECITDTGRQKDFRSEIFFPRRGPLAGGSNGEPPEAA